MPRLQIGIVGSAEFVVGEDHTAREMESGELDILSTPSMMAMMEKAAWTSVQPFLESGDVTVGTLMNVSHESPTPMGMKVECISKLVSIDGRKLSFEVDAYDERGHVGGGMHERFIVPREKFLSKAESKKSR